MELSRRGFLKQVAKITGIFCVAPSLIPECLESVDRFTVADVEAYTEFAKANDLVAKRTAFAFQPADARIVKAWARTLWRESQQPSFLSLWNEHKKQN